ncbi:NRP1 [Candida margitis]|uniref:NRP1 n=1 Tax=Candida margitis TaxID=1775924 RepID=UPI002226E10D|nr:NRP1 [Candida margitis]KAI5968716.1 NRP1 [Candida margitis]
MSDFYIVIYTSTTCDNSNTYVTKDSTELISLAWAVIDVTTLEIIHEETILVRPMNTPITPFCQQKYKLTWEHVRNAGSFKDAINKLDQYVQENIVSQDKEFSFVTFEMPNLRAQLPREARDKGVVLPPYLQHPRLFDLPTEYSKWLTSHPEALSYTASSLSNMMTALEVGGEDSIEGEASLKVYTKITIQLMKKSLPLEDHPTVFTKPYDIAEDVKAFVSEGSKVLYLSNLPSDTTQSELEYWFTQYGGRPVAYWTLKSTEERTINKGSTGFAVFGTHEEATESLAMNGKALGDRVIEVQPSSTKVLDKASDLLTPFPPSKNRPRPGDWTCPSCGFSNFQRRTHCFRCSFPATSAVAIQESIYSGNQRKNEDQKVEQPQTANGDGNNSNGRHSVPFRAGDWKCDMCQYHNFAKNMCCLKCSSAKPIYNTHGNAIHNVNSTAAAIAAATASGQPLNLNNNFVNLHQFRQPARNSPNLAGAHHPPSRDDTALSEKMHSLDLY